MLFKCVRKYDNDVQVYQAVPDVDLSHGSLYEALEGSGHTAETSLVTYVTKHLPLIIRNRLQSKL